MTQYKLSMDFSSINWINNQEILYMCRQTCVYINVFLIICIEKGQVKREIESVFEWSVQGIPVMFPYIQVLTVLPAQCTDN